MAIVRWEPLREISSLQTEMNRLFNQAFDQRRATAARCAAGRRRWTCSRRRSHFVLRADLPGLSEADVNVELEDNVLTVSGERKAEHHESSEGFYRVERAFGAFSRSLTLPKGVDPEVRAARLRVGPALVTAWLEVRGSDARSERTLSHRIGGKRATHGSLRRALHVWANSAQRAFAAREGPARRRTFRPTCPPSHASTRPWAAGRSWLTPDRAARRGTVVHHPRARSRLARPHRHAGAAPRRGPHAGLRPARHQGRDQDARGLARPPASATTWCCSTRSTCSSRPGRS